ncbi:MAG: hypothetical protein COA94_04690 [Rickettsiales bacterium]|nr:MAG: hypothetical protein COA94_04690 [Rickettsiales bacterium]
MHPIRAVRNYLDGRKSGKPCRINAKDYPRSDYSSYWVYFINSETFQWRVDFIDYSTGDTVRLFGKAAKNANKARILAQKCVLKNIEQYRRVS